MNRKKKIYLFFFAGVDKEGIRTDTIIYAKYDTVNNKLYMMSIPRDTYTTSTYAKNNKINNIYSSGKHTDGLVKEVEEMLDTEIDYYCIINLDMIKEVVDKIGGLEINIHITRKIRCQDQTTNSFRLMCTCLQHFAM